MATTKTTRRALSSRREAARAKTRRKNIIAGVQGAKEVDDMVKKRQEDAREARRIREFDEWASGRREHLTPEEVDPSILLPRM
ncbi:hypothetical protein PMI14_03146 [Acidovorax sp. CF316]|uniref:hypothetical protein n=1 Tax=Acidovorax sp. CF316 TaxID=1144317 RepID=UPI00026BD78D|nr:hypothetical protein [Acidovorax sp. CF316]EJE52168.1 hypothetical protein PMI14_03146 [Acidovorax sp. CF316]